MKTIWLSGASGFLGTNLLKSLNKNYQINSILRDNYSQELKGDILIHCGWISASNFNDLNNPNQIDNITESIVLFNRALSGGIKHFYFVSSSWVHGNVFNAYNSYDFKPMVNETSPCSPINLYGFSKLKVEEIWTELAKINNVKLTIIRPFWIYGPNDKENRFIPSIINKCLKNKDVELNPCTHRVDYLYIDDFCSGVELLLDKQVEGIYNFCSGYGFRVKNIINTIFLLTNSSSKLFYNKEYPPGFIQNWVGNDNKLENLGWKHKVDIQEGLKKTIEFYAKRNN